MKCEVALMLPVIASNDAHLLETKDESDARLLVET